MQQGRAEYFQRIGVVLTFLAPRLDFLANFRLLGVALGNLGWGGNQVNCQALVEIKVVVNSLMFNENRVEDNST